MSRVLPECPFKCPVCRKRVRQLYPLTHYDHNKHRWVNSPACLACCGPERDDWDTIGSQFKPRYVQR